jgi:hypothetical protein
MKFSTNKAGDLEIQEMLSEILIPAASTRKLVRAVVETWTPDERRQLAAELVLAMAPVVAVPAPVVTSPEPPK